jgi:hypothetical protein
MAWLVKKKFGYKAVRCLKSYIDKITKDICATSLFQDKPTIYFYPENCVSSPDDLRVLKTREKNVVTLDIGAFRARETILQDVCAGTVYNSQELRSLTPHKCTYGYDVLVYVGYALFVNNLSEQQIIAALARQNVLISQRQIGVLGKKFIAYLAIAHQESRQQLKAAMALRGGYILHLDGTCEGDSPHLFTGIDGIAEIVLDNIKLPSEKAELIVPFLQQIRQRYGDPVALVHDMGSGILSAVKTVFKDIPNFICHFHFLRDIGKDLFEKEYAQIRNRLQKHKIRTLLRQKIKALDKIIGDDTEAEGQLMAGIDRGHIDPSFIKKMPAMATYAAIHWIFDTSAQLEGYGFPFDCPHKLFYQRLKVVHGLVNLIADSRRDNSGRDNKPFLKLWQPLTRIMEDQQLKKAAGQMEEKVKVFNKLREALSIAVPKGKKGLNDDGQEADIKTIAEKVTTFRQTVVTDKTFSQQDDYKKMIKQIDKYWRKLFADPIIVNTPKGPITIQPQRTNNILERFFRDLKRSHRKKSGTVSLNRTLRSILADTPLVKNLDNPDYMKIILDGSRMLEGRFAKIDSRMVIEKIKLEEKKCVRISPEMKKIVRFPDFTEQLTTLLVAQQN